MRAVVDQANVLEQRSLGKVAHSATAVAKTLLVHQDVVLAADQHSGGEAADRECANAAGSALHQDLPDDRSAGITRSREPLINGAVEQIACEAVRVEAAPPSGGGLEQTVRRKAAEQLGEPDQRAFMSHARE